MRPCVQLAAGGLLLTSSSLVLGGTTTKSVTGSVQITGYTALAISTSSNLSFGKVTIPSSGTGSVIATADASPTFTPSGLSEICAGGACTGAAFAVTGQASSSVALTLPASVTLASGSNSLTVTLSMDQAATASLSSTGSLTVHVGGTLVVPAGKAQGSYSGSFTLKGIYN